MVLLLVTILALWSVIYAQDCSETLTCPDGFSCHPALNVCYADAPPTSQLHVWLGEGPDECNRQPSDCDFFMMDYDISHIYGGIGDWCDTGLKVRCVVREAPPLTTTPDNQLRVITYNVFERGWYVSLDGQRERTCRIPMVLASMYPDVDVITIQECFMGGCWPDQVNMRDLLTYVGFPYQTETITSPIKVENGGIFLASRWPILEEDQYVFEAANILSWDFFSAKGVSYAKIQKESRIYHVMSTHFQAGGDNDAYRFNQSVEWSQFVSSKNIPNTEAVIFSGDFNSNFYDPPDGLFWSVLDNLNVAVPELTGPINASSNPVINDLKILSGSKGWGKWIDHVVYGLDYLQPTEAINEILIPADEVPFAICWCEDCINPLRGYQYPTEENCNQQVEYIQDLADHQAVSGLFVFN